MLSRPTPNAILAHQAFLPSISTLPPEPSYHHHLNHNQSSQSNHLQYHHHHQQQPPPSAPPSAHHLHHHHHHQSQQQSHPQHHPHHHPQQSPHHPTQSLPHPPHPLGRPPPKTARRQSKLNNLDRRRICEYAASHPRSTQEDIALQWGIDRSSVSKILKYRDKWLSISPTARAAKVIKHRGGRFPQLESEVVRRCRMRALQGAFLGDRTIKDLALDVSQEIGLGEGAFKASNGWLDAFKERAQIKGGRFLDPNLIHHSVTSEQPQSITHQVDALPTQSTETQAPPRTPQSAHTLLNGSTADIDGCVDEEDEEEEDEEEEDEEEDEDEEEELDEEELDEDDPDQLDEEEGAGSKRSVSPTRLYSPRPSLLMPRLSGEEVDEPATPPLSSPNSSTTGDGPTAVKSTDLSRTLRSPSKSHIRDRDQHFHPDDKTPADHDDAMEGVEEYGDEIETSAEETVVFPSHHHQSSNQPPPPPPLSSHGSQSQATDLGRRHASSFDYRPTSMDIHHSSSTHSRSSSVSVGSHQSSSVFGNGEDPRGPTHGFGPGPTAPSYSHHPLHSTPSATPIRTAPTRRNFPSLRHALSHPALHSSASPLPSPASYYHPYASPGSAPPTHLAINTGRGGGCATLGCCSTASSSSSYSAHSNGNQYHQYGAMPRSAGPELAPVCPSRTGGRVASVMMSRPHSAKEDTDSFGTASIPSATSSWGSSDGWPTNRNNAHKGANARSRVGFDEALGALETVMRFLQEQPTSFATPRDYMVVGELFGRMKEKKQEMAAPVIGGIGMMKLNSNNNPAIPATLNEGNNANTNNRRITRNSSCQGLSLVLEHRSLSPVRSFSPEKKETDSKPTTQPSNDAYAMEQ